MSKDFNFNAFEEIQHMPLRVYNRCVMMNNILNDFGKQQLQTYIEQFSVTERKQLYIMNAFIKKFGVEVAKKKVTEGMTFSDKDHEEALV